MMKRLNALAEIRDRKLGIELALQRAETVRGVISGRYAEGLERWYRHLILMMELVIEEECEAEREL